MCTFYYSTSPTKTSRVSVAAVDGRRSRPSPKKPPPRFTSTVLVEWEETRGGDFRTQKIGPPLTRGDRRGEEECSCPPAVLFGFIPSFQPRLWHRSRQRTTDRSHGSLCRSDCACLSNAAFPLFRPPPPLTFLQNTFLFPPFPATSKNFSVLFSRSRGLFSPAAGALLPSADDDVGDRRHRGPPSSLSSLCSPRASASASNRVQSR